MEKKAVKDSATIFSYNLEYTCYSQHFNFDPNNIKPYNIEDSIYKKYTSEIPPHIVFSNKIKDTVAKIVGSETTHTKKSS
jgi:hypothetical protein